MTTMTSGVTTGTSAAPPTGRRLAARRVLSTMERLMFRGDALHVARANAWAAVLSDRERARQRAEAEAALDEHEREQRQALRAARALRS